MADRTIVLTMVDESHARPGSLLEVLLQSFKSGLDTQRFLNHLDTDVLWLRSPLEKFDKLYELSISCNFSSAEERAHSMQEGGIFFMKANDEALEFMKHWRLKKFLYTSSNVEESLCATVSKNQDIAESYGFFVNEMDTNHFGGFCQDTDVLWLRSPLENFDPSYELSISCNFSSDGERTYSMEGGIFFMKANAAALEFLKHWKLSMFLYLRPNAEESLCETITQNVDIADAYGVRVHHIDRNQFGGFCQLNNDMFETVYTIHANCCDDLTSKVHDMTIVLDDWIRFRKRVKNNNATEKMTLRWPQKCIG
ncbi:uncharacterized protein At1g28695 [Medicago truncatula]|uniref:uncharacterized protein At1g28695 n=1 Tax=Medicago truncatula TaxID=3880 RepID=UPI000D2F358E|nr:uncharacterized protein At1g28695 [Medicago truncatula]